MKKFVAWNVDNEIEFFDTEAEAKKYCWDQIDIERDDGWIREEALPFGAIGYAEVKAVSVWKVNDHKENFKYESEDEIPEGLSDEEYSNALCQVWPYDSDWDYVGEFDLEPVHETKIENLVQEGNT